VQVLVVVIQIIAFVISAWMYLLMLYQLFLNCFGFKAARRDYDEHDPETRFLVLIPAHNEERVITDIIANLQKMDYPKELYDFYVIADNCTDQTAEVARSCGAQVIVTEKEAPDAPTGKPIALKKALDQLEGYQDRYDLLMIFDADNLMDTNMFREINSQYLDKNKPEFIQCYLGCKNRQGVIPWFYYTSYVVVNRFVQLAKYRLGLNCSIGGTGFAISTKYLFGRGGWTTMSLTADLEIQVEATLAGKRILWNHFARVYDEKPTSCRASFHQKTRWNQGYTFVAVRNTPKIFRALLSRQLPVREFLSILSYMYGMFSYLLVLVQGLCSLLLMLPVFQYPQQAFTLLSAIPGVLLFCYSYLFLFYFAAHRDDHELHLSTLPMMLYSLVVNMGVSIASQIAGVARWRHQQHWVKTEHSLHRAPDEEHPSLPM